MTIERNAERMQEHVGKTIESIEDTRTSHKELWWCDTDGFIVHFTDGTQVELVAGFNTNDLPVVEVWSE